MGILSEISNLLNRATNRARTTARSSEANTGARLGQVDDLATLRQLLEEALRFVKEAELAAGTRYAQAERQAAIDSDQLDDLDSLKQLSDNRNLFRKKDVGTVLQDLRGVDPDTFGRAWWQLEVEKRAELDAAIDNDALEEAE